jgi:hypothetical protein
MNGRLCELCGWDKGGIAMRYAKRAVCFSCIDKVLEFAVTAGMRFDTDETT